ncbi:hypothetical protein B7486_66295, partial [cyanobacterium TDX16]
DAELVAEVRRAAPHLTFVWARDRGTLDELGLEPGARTFVGPDLTWLAPLDPGGGALDRRGVAVAVAPHAGLDPQTWGPALASLPRPVRPWPFWTERDADGRVLRSLLPEADVPAEHHPDVGRASQVVVSARYHGLVFALQLGRPVVGIGDSPKVRRLLHEQGLADWHVPADRPDRVGPVVAGLLADLGTAEARAAEVHDRLVGEAAAAAARAWALAEQEARPLEGRSGVRRRLRLD